MTYAQDFSGSSKRHLRAAQELYDLKSAGAQPGCNAVAGYLFGLCGELAVKSIMRASGMKPMNVDQRRDDPFFAHFPELKSRLRDAVHGRRSGELRRIAETSTLFQNWDTAMRYASTAAIFDAWVDAWKTSAIDLVNRMDLP